MWPAACPLGRPALPLEYLSRLGKDKRTSQQIPNGDGQTPNQWQSAGRGGSPALPATKVLGAGGGKSYRNDPTLLAKYKHSRLNHRGQVTSRQPHCSVQETSNPAGESIRLQRGTSARHSKFRVPDRLHHRSPYRVAHHFVLPPPLTNMVTSCSLCRSSSINTSSGSVSPPEALGEFPAALLSGSE